MHFLLFHGSAEFVRSSFLVSAERRLAAWALQYVIARAEALGSDIGFLDPWRWKYAQTVDSKYSPDFQRQHHSPLCNNAELDIIKCAGNYRCVTRPASSSSFI